jgi:hypothetical protein
MLWELVHKVLVNDDQGYWLLCGQGGKALPFVRPLPGRGAQGLGWQGQSGWAESAARGKVSSVPFPQGTWTTMDCPMGSAQSPTPPQTDSRAPLSTEKRMGVGSSSSSMAGTLTFILLCFVLGHTQLSFKGMIQREEFKWVILFVCFLFFYNLHKRQK